MKTIEDLKNRIKELGKQAAELSQEAVQVSKTNRVKSRSLMQQAQQASKRCQILIQELKRQQT